MVGKAGVLGEESFPSGRKVKRPALGDGQGVIVVGGDDGPDGSESGTFCGGLRGRKSSPT